MFNPIINTPQGNIKGRVTKNYNNVQYYTFGGIPYAKAPVGELRFTAPQPTEPWKGVRDGAKECNICVQFDKKAGRVVGDEDCLFLNVYTPRLPEENSALLPVMIYCHGGGFLAGNGTDSALHGPDFLIEKDVVLISMNYRVGILGFLSLDCKEAPGNMGLKDQVTALKWTRHNIACFGGDPNNVTIFGTSAGGACVEYLFLSSMTKGLFHKAITQSGTTLMHWAQNANIKELASEIPALKGKVIEDDNKLLKYLKDMPIEELIMSSMAVVKSRKLRAGFYFGFVPTIEKATDWEPLIDKSTYQILAKGDFTKVPYMTGISSREGLLTAPRCKADLDKFVKEKKFYDCLPFELDEVEKDEIEAKLKDIYVAEDISLSNAFAINFFGDIDFLGAVYVSAMLIAKNRCPVYFYEFAHDGALNYVKKYHGIKNRGACHGDEISYLLKCAHLTDSLSESDKSVQKLMADLWTNFARNGDPNPKTDNLIAIKWEPITETSTPCFVIKEKPYLKSEIYPARTKFFKELYAKVFGGK